MAMQIAILGWGSLLWDERPQFDRHHTKWQENDGPSLKPEFSRVSKNRNNALTLVVDQDHGSNVGVAWCLSTRDDVDKAREDLRRREGCRLEHIGCAAARNNLSGAEQPTIADWAKARKLDFVVWTALPSNFEEKVGEPFSTERAVSHLRGLDPQGQRSAVKYVRQAPDFVQTRLRSTLEDDAWFQSL